MPRLREALVFEGGGAGIDTWKAHAWGIERLWWEASDPVASKESLAACRSRGIGVGLKMNGTGAVLAGRMHSELTLHGFGTSTGPRTCGAMFDDELHRPEDTFELLRSWRTFRPTRYTILTFEPFQGGLFASVPELVHAINVDPNLIVVPFAYMDLAGDQLYPAWAPAAIDDLVAAGILRERISIFIGVKTGVQISFGWSGILYGFAGLPATPPTTL